MSSSTERSAKDDSGFTKTTHHAPYAAIDPSTAPLPTPFVACIIGSTGVIGAGIAHAYARAGATGLLLASRRTAKLTAVAATARRLNPAAHVESLACDVTRAADVAAVAATARRVFGRLDAVVVEAGWSGPVTRKVAEGAPEVFAQVTQVNYVGTYHAAHFLVPLLLESEGGGRAFVAVGSFAAGIVSGVIANTQYCVSKLAQAKLVEHVAEQYADEGLLVASVHPGAVASENAMETAPEEFKQYLVDDPELCGAFIVWLTRNRDELMWLNGRLVSAKWDVDELCSRKDEIISKDLLKFKLQF